MRDIDEFAVASLPIAYQFYKNSIEGDGLIFEFEHEHDETLPSTDLKIVADYAYLLAKAMSFSSLKYTGEADEVMSWVKGHDDFIQRLMTPKGE